MYTYIYLSTHADIKVIVIENGLDDPRSNPVCIALHVNTPVKDIYQFVLLQLRINCYADNIFLALER